MNLRVSWEYPSLQQRICALVAVHEMLERGQYGQPLF